MERLKSCSFEMLLIILTVISVGSHRLARAEDGTDKAQALVFDPETKKYFIGGNAKFMLKQADQNSLIDAIEVSTDGADYQPYKGAIQFKQEGKHIIKFRAVNPVNNWSPIQVMELFVDLTPPSTDVKFSDDKSYTEGKRTFTQLNSMLSLSAGDNLSGIASIEFSWDNVTFKPYLRPIQVEKTGPQTIYYRSIDRVGNVEPIRTMEFVADGVAPFSTLKESGLVRPSTIEGKGYLAASDSVAFSIESTDELSKVKNIWVSVDGKPLETYKKPIYFLQEGPHSLKYYAEDQVGNREEAKTVQVYTISVPPTSHAVPVGHVVNTGGINYATTQIQLRIDAKETVVGLERIEVRLNDEKEFHTYLQPLRFNRLGPNIVAYRAVDRAGNAEPTKIFNVNIWETAPETNIETAQPLVVRGNIRYSPAPNIITLNVNNSQVGIAKTMVSINEKPFDPYTGPITLTADQKVYKISFKSIDKLGNEEKPKTVTYHMMNTIPIVDLFVSDGQSAEEQVRTKYVDSPTVAPKAAGPKKPDDGSARDNASTPGGN